MPLLSRLQPWAVSGLLALFLLVTLERPAHGAYECFQVPNRPVPFFEQASLFSQDLQVITEAIMQTGVVFSAPGDCLVQAQASPDMTTRITTGCTIAQHGATATVTTGNLTHAAANTSFPRIDYISASNTGAKIVTAGTPAASPVPPVIPQSGGFNNVLLAEVYIPAGDTAIGSTQIVDKRGCIPTPGGGGGGSGTVTHLVGALTADRLVIGNGGADIEVLGSLGTTTTVLHGNAAGAPTFGAVSLTTDVSGITPIANGGTAQATAAAARAASGLNMESATPRGNANYTILATDKLVYTNAAFTAPRVWTLPSANAVNAGHRLCVIDAAAGVTSANTLQILRAGSDTIDGLTSMTFDAAGDGLCLFSDGTSKWITDQGLLTRVLGIPHGSGRLAVWQAGGRTIGSTASADVTQGGTGLASGTSGGIPGFTSSTTMASSGALGANLPVIGGGAGATPTTGTRSGNTTAFVTTTGTQTSGRCVVIDANGNHVADSVACGGVGGSVTVRKNTGADVGSRPRLNFIEGSNVTLTVADDAGSNEVDVTIAASGAGGGPTITTFATSTPSDATSTALTINSLTVRTVARVFIPGAITLNQLTFAPGTVSTAGTMRLCLYSIDGATKLVDVVSGASATNVPTSTAVGAVVIPAGEYYFAMGCATTCNMNVLGYIAEAGSATLFGNLSPSGKPKWHGTVTHTSGTCNTTLGTITGTATAQPVVRGDN